MANELTPLEQAAAGEPDDSGGIRGAYLGHIHDLVASGLCNRKQAAFAAWYSAPKKYRLPRTQAELAALLNLKSDTVFFKWRHSEWWPKAVNRAGLELLEQYNADAHRRLVQLALTEGGSPGVAALRLFFERAGQLSAGITLDLPEDSNFERALRRAYGPTENDDENSDSPTA